MPSTAAAPGESDDRDYRQVVWALALGQIISWAALYYAFSSFVLPMMGDLGWGKATMMGAFTLGLAVWGAATYAVGAAVDQGRGRLVMTLGAVVAGLGFLLWSQVRTPPMLYAACALLGAAMAMTLYEPAFNVLTKRFPGRYTQGITTLTLVGGFASTLSFPASALLIQQFGWRGALQVIGAILLCVVAPLHAWALRGPALVATVRHADQQADATLHEALQQRSFWLLTLCFMLYAFASAALWAHIMPAFAAKGMSEAQALAVLVWIGPAQVAGRFVYAWAGRGVSLRLIGLFVLLGMPASLALFALSTQWWPLFVFAALFGVANGLVTIVRGGLVPQYFGRAHIGRIGGVMSGVGLLARAAAPLATAWLLLAMPGYREVMLVLAALGIAAALAFAMASPPCQAG